MGYPDPNLYIANQRGFLSTTTSLTSHNQQAKTRKKIL